MKRKEVNRDDLSPMMKQYMEIKDEHEDELLFFRLGDFYELFFEDGEIASRELELTLTGKNAGLKERVPMCGVPHHSVKAYIEKLINKSYKVAICEQLEDAKNVKGPNKTVKRGVVQVISKGTFVDLEFLDSKDTNYIGSIIDANYEYILSYADISTGELFTETIPHKTDKLIDEVLSLNLKEVVLKSDFDLSVINLLKNNYGINISLSNEELTDKYQNLYKDIIDERNKISIRHLLYYLHIKQLKDLDHLNCAIMLKRDDYLSMNIHTIRNLELVETLRLKERQNSLIWLLDKTKTAMGCRMLKQMLLNPLRDKEEINKRLDKIEKLNNEFLLREELRNNLYEIYDLERLCGKVVCGSLNARDLLQIKSSLKVIPEINKILAKLNFNETLKEENELYELLENAIDEDAPITIKEGHIIKCGFNDELDELKTIRKGGKDFIASLEQEEKERTGISTLKVGYNRVFGYYIEVSKGQINKIDESLGWERRQTLSNAERFITPSLKEKEALVLNAEERIVELEYHLFLSLKEEVKKHLANLKSIAATISLIDAITSLSIASEEYSLTRPIITDTRSIFIKDGFHPVVQTVSKKEYVKNDIIMDEKTDTLLITGPNMSGKSTYMRQLAITIILAQMGSFVPASECSIPIFDNIFTRIGASDDLVSGESTFMVEMLEANSAISNATKDSLILFDELGRGTATYDGMSLARAILEYVNTQIKCKTLFSTHYHELTVLSNEFDNIKNVHVDAIEENNKIIFLHKVKDGSIDKSYGIHVASLANMPNSLIKRAKEILESYENMNQEPKVISKQISFDFEEKKNEVCEELKELDLYKMTPIDAMNKLYELVEKSKKY